MTVYIVLSSELLQSIWTLQMQSTLNPCAKPLLLNRKGTPGHMLGSAVQVNDYQIRLRGMTRHMMATVSEMTMYQAHSIKLKADKESLQGVVTAAADKLEVGWHTRTCTKPPFPLLSPPFAYPLRNQQT